MKIVWKLLRQHLSIAQFIGFSLANLLGMVIVLFSIQFYNDVIPIFTQQDSFMKKDYLILSKKVSTLGSVLGKSNTFSEQEIEEVRGQSFAKDVGIFTPCLYNVSAGISLAGQNMDLSTQMFFESVPDSYIDVKSKEWNFKEGTDYIPIILPKNYLNLYNYGFAQSRSLPQLSEGVLGMIQINITIRGNGQIREFKGKITGFSNRLNTILVPEDFMKWSNQTFGNRNEQKPSRLIVEVSNPTDETITSFLQNNGYETEGGNTDAGKTNHFLKLITGLVIVIGLLISALSFFILMLSIYLLLQKNTKKLENLLLVGYSPGQVAQPYLYLTGLLNIIVLLLSLATIFFLRSKYLPVLSEIWPDYEPGSVFPTIGIGLVIFLTISFLNGFAIQRKIAGLWICK